MVGNGLFTFAYESAKLDEYMPEETLVYFNERDDLLSKMREFHHNDDKHRYWVSKA